MQLASVLAIYGLFSLWAETYLFGLLTWFDPNLFLLSALLLILHWRGPEGYFIAAGFGLLADVYSSTPFGTYALAFFLVSFPARWYAVKIFQDAMVTLPVVVGVFSLVSNGVVYLVLYLFFGENRFSWFWLNELIGRDALPLAALSAPLFLALLWLEDRLRIRLSMRKF